MEHDILLRIAELLKERNRIDHQIAEIIDRPMTSGHLGEWIAAEAFDIKLASQQPRLPSMATSARPR